MSAAPMPPRSLPGTYEPMTLAEAEGWIESHARWVEKWNRHERSRDLPLSPEWIEAESVALFAPWPQSCIGFRVAGTGRLGIMRFRGFRVFHDGWSFCRNAGSLDRLVWAGWLASPQWDP